MAQKIQVVLVDDLDGGEADATVRFGLDGVEYEIDLSAEHAEALRGALAPFVGAARRIPVVARALAAPGLASRLEYPHTFRVEGVAFLIMMALGHLPALFALPAGLGDIAAGIAAPLVAYQLARGTGRRAARWHNAFGITDLVVALTLGALTGFQLLTITPSAAPLFGLPLALIVTAGVPLLLALHIASMSALAKAPRTPLPATGPLIAGPAPGTASSPARKALT